MVEWLTTVEAAKLLAVHPQTLANWRSWQKGPKYRLDGREVRYSRTEVERYKRVLDGGRRTG